MGTLILNCDLGENEAFEQTEQLLALVDAASIGCGFHAGSAEKTRRTLECATQQGVLIGAHPGLAEAGGRGASLPSASEFAELLETQIRAFLALAEEVGAQTSYVKLHGSLYHAVENDPELADAYVRFMANLQPKLGVMAIAGGSCAKLAEAHGLKVYHEAFADRRYQSDASLTPRSESNAVLSHQDALTNIQTWLRSGEMPTRQDAAAVTVRADTLCVHADSPGSVKMITELRRILKSPEEGA